MVREILSTRWNERAVSCSWAMAVRSKAVPASSSLQKRRTSAGRIPALALARGLHPLTAFLHRSVGQPHNDEGGQAVGRVHFGVDDDPIQSKNGA